MKYPQRLCCDTSPTTIWNVKRCSLKKENSYQQKIMILSTEGVTKLVCTFFTKN